MAWIQSNNQYTSLEWGLKHKTALNKCKCVGYLNIVTTCVSGVKQMEMTRQSGTRICNLHYIFWLTWLLQCDANNIVPTIAQRHKFLFLGCIVDDTNILGLSIFLLAHVVIPSPLRCVLFFSFLFLWDVLHLTQLFIIKHTSKAMKLKQWLYLSFVQCKPKKNKTIFLLLNSLVSYIFDAFLPPGQNLLRWKFATNNQKTRKKKTKLFIKYRVTWISNDYSYNRGFGCFGSVIHD